MPPKKSCASSAPKPPRLVNKGQNLVMTLYITTFCLTSSNIYIYIYLLWWPSAVFHRHRNTDAFWWGLLIKSRQLGCLQHANPGRSAKSAQYEKSLLPHKGMVWGTFARFIKRCNLFCNVGDRSCTLSGRAHRHIVHDPTSEAFGSVLVYHLH